MCDHYRKGRTHEQLVADDRAWDAEFEAYAKEMDEAYAKEMDEAYAKDHRRYVLALGLCSGGRT